MPLSLKWPKNQIQILPVGGTQRRARSAAGARFDATVSIREITFPSNELKLTYLSCKTCQVRSTPCVYRDFTRLRKKKHERPEDGCKGQQTTRLAAKGLKPTDISDIWEASPPLNTAKRQNGKFMPDLPRSVSAIHKFSPSCQTQLYYGPSSHFALIQHIYRDLMSKPTAPPMPSGEMEEAGAGLDLFSFRRIFFGTSASYDTGSRPSSGDLTAVFLPYDLANLFLMRFLSTFYQMMPHCPKAHLEQYLKDLYHPSPAIQLDSLTQAVVLLSLAIGSLATDYFTWGDLLFERVKASMATFEEIVNLRTVQISILMISFTTPQH